MITAIFAANSARKMANPSTLCRFNGVGLSSQSKIQSQECVLPQSLSSVCHGVQPFAARPSGCNSSTTERLRTRCRGSSGAETPPESREQAIEQAAASLSRLLEKALKQRGPSTVKQRKEQRQVKLRVEVPVLDDNPSSLLSLTLDLLSALLRNSRGSVAVYSHVEMAKSEIPNVSFYSLQSESTLSGDVSLVVVPGVRFEDTQRLQQLARSVAPRPVVVLNPEWSPEDERDSFVASFETAYAFQPLSIQGFFTKSEAAVLKSVPSPWLIFVKEGGKFTRLSSLKRRPGPAELESALYNAMAANSPVTKSIKFLRGLVSKE